MILHQAITAVLDHGVKFLYRCPTCGWGIIGVFTGGDVVDVTEGWLKEVTEHFGSALHKRKETTMSIATIHDVYEITAETPMPDAPEPEEEMPEEEAPAEEEQEEESV